jgi:hypothetical protein
MGFNKVHLPTIEELKKMVEDWGAESVLNRYKGPKVDCLIGSSDSMEYLDSLVEFKDEQDEVE